MSITESLVEIYGQPVKSDTPFRARMRFHQSWYRVHVLKLPMAQGGNGSRISLDDAGQGCNFLNAIVANCARQRLNERTGAMPPDRVLCNLLTSQVLCLNLFGYLQADPALASRLFRALVPDLKNVTQIKIEFAPEPASEYLADRTAFDAFVEYRNDRDEPCFIGIETKLTETFSPQHYDRPEYRRWTEGEASPWKTDSLDQLDDLPHNQLWRDHLLMVAYRNRRGYVSAYTLVVFHNHDVECLKTLDSYRPLLKTEDKTLIVSSLSDLVGNWQPLLIENKDRLWLDSFRARYLDLSLSEASWNAYSQTVGIPMTFD